MYKILGQQSRKPSGFFGKLVAKMMEMRNKASYEKIIDELNVKNGDRIYEIGYGHGLGINLIATKTNDCLISGIDFSELMYKKAVKRNKKFIDHGKVKLEYGDLLTVEHGDAKYNKIFCVNVVYFWSDLVKAFKKVHSLMDDEGIYCIYMTHPEVLEKLKFTEEFCKYSINEVEKALKNAGFDTVEYKYDVGYYIKAKK